MSILDNAVDVTVALGKGVYSVGADVVFGFQRTGEGFGLGEDGRVADIGYENRAMVGLLRDSFNLGVNNTRSPLFKAIVHILEHYYSYFPDEALEYLARQAGIGVGFAAGRLVVGKKLAEAVAVRVAAVVSASAGYRAVAARLGVSAGASATGVGIPITLLMLQGIMQRSSHASRRLKNKSPSLYTSLKRNGNLQLIYFILEKPLENYIEAIEAAEKTPSDFNEIINRKYAL